MAYALIDPKWGEPEIVLSTVRETEDEAWDAAIHCGEAALYSGASPAAHKAGSRGMLERYGFRVEEVNVSRAHRETTPC